MNAPAQISEADHVAWGVVRLIQTLKGTSAGDILRDAVAAEFGLAPAEPRDPLADDPTLLVDVRRLLTSRVNHYEEIKGVMKRLTKILQPMKG